MQEHTTHEQSAHDQHMRQQMMDDMHEPDKHEQGIHEQEMHKLHYRRLGLMALLSFVSMYSLMYAMVNVASNVLPNANQFYMAGLMTAPMIVFEVLLMGMMYPNKRLNAGIIAAAMIAGALFFGAIRQQAAVGDEQFLKSMIPHHAGAILMCEQAPIQDAEIQALCGQIVESQQREIDQMKDILDRLEN